MKLAIVVPAYNEEPLIGSVLQHLSRTIEDVSSVEVIVVDDGSTDRTATVAREHGAVVLEHLVNRGLGAALGTGLTYAKDHGFDVAVTIDADGQHDPGDFPRVVQPILERRADVVIGTRLKNPDGMPLVRRFGIWLFNVITYALFGVWTSDSQSGLRAFSRRALEQMVLNFEGMEVSSGFFSEIGRLRLRVSEVPIRPIYTDYSLAKGQRPSNGVSILVRLLWHKFIR